jgi:hypothetical protein
LSNKVHCLQDFRAIAPTSAGVAGPKRPHECRTTRSWAWYRTLFQFEGLAEELLQQDDWHLFREFLQGYGDIEDYIAELSRPGALTAALNWYRASLPVQRLMAPAPTLPPVQAPTLGIWSTGDQYFLEFGMKRSENYLTSPFSARTHGGSKPLDPAGPAGALEQPPAGVLASPQW